ncbi:predicted protein [Histoplasma mississippiense (nom. inval.)]|uniref:predicted protein n=1 Tax=Ajellomyces capsulatus (strain NAm1 / WU24) TaxID=2059318 RepID=UPI000157D5E4|nr:predicted protein [Histoplasma mississippiense (nom. inval.)]EDN05357.1 predicted protein [Histoplasma mississippiense (nom. inval.)]
MSAVLIATQSYLNTCQQTSQCEVYPSLAILRVGFKLDFRMILGATLMLSNDL